MERHGARLVLPGLCKLYRRDFEDLLAFTAVHMPNDDARRLREHDGNTTIDFDRFDWTLVPGGQV